ncbi:CDP-diacylglycerol--glycerol-3-phosphate 3-phosphatidyltransferase [Gordonia sp. CPCC 205515]|uniref:CDP-diacylglycerol--glycerol-3-phosphate 3-phosphatidyltransferase n=1 Tax=Gordonia sp. CPCC 205515 TaxID=3140791 RepID=UPI003AF3D1F4
MTDRMRRAVEDRGLANAGRAPDHITDPVHHVPVVNIANALTVFRIVLVPVFIVVLFAAGGHDTGWRIAAAAVFAVAAITDRYDGKIARQRGLITDFGKMADPIADKALMGAALVGLSILGDLSWWVTAIILVRELGVTALRFWVLRHGVIPASRGGKLKTLLQAIAIGLYLLPLAGAWHVAAVVVMAAAVVVTVITGFDYIWQAVALRSRSTGAAPDSSSDAGRR